MSPVQVITPIAADGANAFITTCRVHMGERVERRERERRGGRERERWNAD